MNLHVLLNVTEWGFAFMLTNVDDLVILLVDTLLIVSQGWYSENCVFEADIVFDCYLPVWCIYAVSLAHIAIFKPTSLCAFIFQLSIIGFHQTLAPQSSRSAKFSLTLCIASYGVLSFCGHMDILFFSYSV